MKLERNQLDVNRLHPHLGKIYYELEDEKKNGKYNLAPRRMRTIHLQRIPMLASPPDEYGYSDEPRFRWVTSTWSYEEPQAHMQKWDERYRRAYGQFQGSRI